MGREQSAQRAKLVHDLGQPRHLPRRLVNLRRALRGSHLFDAKDLARRGHISPTNSAPRH